MSSKRALESQDAIISYVSYAFREEMPLSNFALKLLYETVKKLEIFNVIGEFVILGKSVKYDEKLGLIL